MHPTLLDVEDLDLILDGQDDVDEPIDIHVAIRDDMQMVADR